MLLWIGHLLKAENINTVNINEYAVSTTEESGTD